MRFPHETVNETAPKNELINHEYAKKGIPHPFLPPPFPHHPGGLKWRMRAWWDPRFVDWDESLQNTAGPANERYTRKQ